jgi:hypothetical protein
MHWRAAAAPGRQWCQGRRRRGDAGHWLAEFLACRAIRLPLTETPDCSTVLAAIAMSSKGCQFAVCLLVVSRLAAATQLAALGSTWLHVGFFSVLPLLIFQLISTGSSALAATLGALVTIAGRCRPAPLQCALARWQSGQTGRLFTLAQWCQDPAASTAAPCRLLRPRPRCRLTPGRSAMSHCSRASALALASF